MANKLDSLSDLTLSSIPAAFFRQLASRQSGLYQEAAEMAMRSPLWREPEGETVVPIIRRALFESEFRKAAKMHGLDHFDMRHAGDNYGYGLVRSGRVVVTAHYVAGPRQFVRPCTSRKQNAAVNHWLDTLVMRELLNEPLPDLSDPELVYAYILHGVVHESRAGKKFSSMFLRLAFPDSELSRYARNFAVLDLLQKYDAVERTGTGAADLNDNARPVINIKPKRDKGEMVS